MDAPRRALGSWSLAALLTWSLGVGSIMAPNITRGSWKRIETEHFIFFTNETKALSIEIARRLEKLQVMLRRVTSGLQLQSSLPILVYVFQDPRPKNPSGFLETPDAYYIAFPSTDEQEHHSVISHHYVQLILRMNFATIPRCLEEGLADYFITFDTSRDWVDIGRPGYLARLARSPPYSIDELLTIDADLPNDSRRLFRAQSWAFVHYLLQADPEGSGRFWKFMERLQRGESPLEALLAAYQTNQSDLQENFEAYVQQRTFHFTHYQLKEKLRKPEVRVRQMRRHEVLYHLADLLLHTRPLQRETVEKLLRAAIKKEPSYAEPYRAQALLASFVGRHEEAISLYEKALSLDPENPQTHSMMGRSLLQQYLSFRGEEETRPATVPALVLRARGSFEASLDLDPGYYESLVGLGRTFLYGDEDVSVGINALSNASQLLPGRLDALHHLIVLAARSGDTAIARELYYHTLLPRGDSAIIQSTEDLLSRAEVEQIRALLASGIDAIDRGRVEEALGYIDKTVDISRTSVRLGGAEEMTRPLLDQSSAILERILGSQPGEDVQRRAEELLTKVRAQ